MSIGTKEIILYNSPGKQILLVQTWWIFLCICRPTQDIWLKSRLCNFCIPGLDEKGICSSHFGT